MAAEQIQWFCQRCATYTLHARHTPDCPHVIHALVSLFMCGLWCPVWVIHCLIVQGARDKTPYLCSRCGQSAGLIPPGATTPAAPGNSPFAGPAQKPPPKPPPPHGTATGGWG